MSRAFCCLAVFACLLISHSARGQFSGSISTGVETSSNIQSLDTTAPDRLILPAIQLDYLLHPSLVSSINLLAGTNPVHYTVNQELSYTALAFSIAGAFYLTNQDAIKAEAAESGVMHAAILPARGTAATSTVRGATQAESESEAEIISTPAGLERPASGKSGNSGSVSSTEEGPSGDPNDSLIQSAITNLYTLSGSLDSTDVPTSGLTKSRVSQLESLRDSISEVTSTFADLLDSEGYTESVADVMLPEIQGLSKPLNNFLEAIKGVHVSKEETRRLAQDAGLLEGTLQSLRRINVVGDFLSEFDPVRIPQAGSGISPAAIRATTSHALSSAAADEEDNSDTPSAPPITLLSSSTRLREFSSGDATIPDDASDSGATTLASLLTVPLSYSVQTGQQVTTTGIFGNASTSGNPNDVRTFAFDAGYDFYTSSALGFRLSYDHSDVMYPYDTVYSNTENRVRLGSRIGLGASFMAFGEFSLGLRKYTDPIQTGAKKPQNNAGDFTQFSYGGGIAATLGDLVTLGALAAFNTNPNLRAYVADASLIARKRSAVQIADDEYTYDLSRFAIFGAFRLPWSVDAGIDISHEDRTYGALAKKLPKGNFASGAGRTESGNFANVSLTRIFPFEDRLLSIFQSFTLESALYLSFVDASDPMYSYRDASVTVSANLGF